MGVGSPFHSARQDRRPAPDDRQREVLNALLYLASAGCAWRLLLKCFPPVSTVRRYFYAWRDAGLFDAINTVLVMNLREIEGREASPSAGVLDSQSVKTTESGGVTGYDAGKKVKGRKRHIVTDTYGFLIFILVHAADIQDRDGAVDVLAAIRHRFPWLHHIFADGGYAGDKLCDALATMGQWTVEIIKRRTPPKASRFYPADGSWNEPSPGSDDAGASPKIGKPPSPPQPHGRLSPPSVYSLAEPQDIASLEKLPNRALRGVGCAGQSLTSICRSKVWA